MLVSSERATRSRPGSRCVAARNGPPEASRASTSAITTAPTFATTAPVLFGLTNLTFFSLFPGDTVVVGNSGEQGNVTIGSLGKISLAAGTNLVIDTAGGVTGLGTVITTGTVILIQPVIFTPGQAGATVGSDNTSTGLGDQTDKKKLGQNSGSTGGQQNGTVSQESSTGSVCH